MVQRAKSETRAEYRRAHTHNFKLIGLSSFKFVEKRNEIVQFAGLLFLFFGERKGVMEQRQQAFTQQHQHKYTNGQKRHAKHQIQHDDTLYVCVYSLMFSIPIRKDLAKFSLSL